jgi:hypothetical protein
MPDSGSTTRWRRNSPKSEINDNALSATKIFLDSLIFTPPEGELSFNLPTPAGDINWSFSENLPVATPVSELAVIVPIPQENDITKQSFNHVLTIPAPIRPPYIPGDQIKIETEQVIEDPEIIPEAANSNNPNKVFSTVATQKLKDSLPGLEADPIESYLEDQAYYRTMTDIMKSFVDKILESNLFQQEVDPDIMNWRLEPISDIKGTTQTTLLGIEDLRNKTKQRYEGFTVNENEGISENLQKAITGAAVESVIRLSVVEMILRTLPVFDMFDKNDIISDEFVKYVTIKVQESCVRQDPFAPGYYESILGVTNELYEEAWSSNNQSLTDPVTGASLPSPSQVELDATLDYFIKNTILNMSNEIKSLTIFSAAEPDSIYKIFLNDMMLEFDAPAVDTRDKPLNAIATW